ncbi:MAG TPA: serine hydrolase domain-containing protein [Pyrinomonadaceae bacterium]|nr:serine hydrolase domain-containing protein [Pyrinomonadaceae bacterium]
MKWLWLIVAMLSTIMNIRGQMDDRLNEFKTLYETELKQAGVVGSGFVFVKDGGTLADYRYGLANIAKNQPVDADTIWHWASNTKPFTGVAIMQLRDRGLLKLDDPVTKYLPELRAVHNPYGSMDEITIRQLMTHSAGFRGSTWPWDKGEPWEPFEPTEYSQLVAMFPFTEILFKPGTKFSYSNPGIIFLGRIIEKLSGEDYEVYIDKNIFRPLEMHRSYFDTTPPYLINHRSHSYYLRDGKRTEGRFDANTGITVSNSGLNAPLGDMVKWVNFLVGDPSKRDIYDLVLKRSSLEEMWKPQLKTETDSNGDRGYTTDIGLIFFLDTTLSPRHLGHGGDQNAFISYIDFDPTKRAASILVFNTDVTYPSGTPAEKKVVDKLRKAVRAMF